MRLSQIVCSRNRATQLKATLSKIDPDALVRHKVELLLVGSASDEATMAAMEDYANLLPSAVRIVRVDEPGLGQARNAGLRAATGELFVFTDDDCYLEKNYYDALLKDFDPTQCHYGMGQVLLFDPSDDGHIACYPFTEKRIIHPRTLLPAGAVQGANMFALRQVFERVGPFADDIPGRTHLRCEDIEFANRASVAGFTGVHLPSVIVYHHHGRKPGSAEADQILCQYDTGRGAYYAIQLTRGINECWQLWSQLSRTQGPMPDALAARLEREFRGAADFLKYHLSTRKRPS
jgi:GT2 family glycosyltransferase